MKSFTYILKKRRSGKSKAVVYEISETEETPHNFEPVGCVNFFDLPRDKEARKNKVLSWLRDQGHVAGECFLAEII